MIAIHIPLMKARQNKTSMDGTDYVVFLRLHGEYLQRLTTELTTALATLEHALRGQTWPPRGVRGPIQRLAEAQRLLNTETESFGRRLTHFLRVTHYTPGSREPPQAAD